MFWWLRTVVRRRVVVNLADKAFDGVLVSKRGPLLVLRNVTLLEPGAEPQPLDGKVVVERSKVDFIQEPGGG